MLYAQRQALNRPLFQRVSACYTHKIKSCWILLGLGRVKPTGFAVCAHKLIRARSYGLIVLQIVASSMLLDTAWPWANDTYGLCCLRAYFCAHKLIRARSYVVIPGAGAGVS